MNTERRLEMVLSSHKHVEMELHRVQGSIESYSQQANKDAIELLHLEKENARLREALTECDKTFRLLEVQRNLFISEALSNQIRLALSTSAKEK